MENVHVAKVNEKKKHTQDRIRAGMEVIFLFVFTEVEGEMKGGIGLPCFSVVLGVGLKK